MEIEYISSPQAQPALQMRRPWRPVLFFSAIIAGKIFSLITLKVSLSRKNSDTLMVNASTTISYSPGAVSSMAEYFR